MKITIPAGTSVLINGVTVAFDADTEASLPSAASIDDAAALAAIAGINANLNHFDEEKGVNVVYRNGERVELSPESVAPVAAEEPETTEFVGEDAIINEPEAGEPADEVVEGDDAETTETDPVIE